MGGSQNLPASLRASEILSEPLRAALGGVAVGTERLQVEAVVAEGDGVRLDVVDLEQAKLVEGSVAELVEEARAACAVARRAWSSRSR